MGLSRSGRLPDPIEVPMKVHKLWVARNEKENFGRVSLLQAPVVLGRLKWIPRYTSFERPASPHVGMGGSFLLGRPRSSSPTFLGGLRESLTGQQTQC